MADKKENFYMEIIDKEKNFSKWYSQIIEKAEIVDIRLGVKGFTIIRPWGALIMNKMFELYEKELQEKKHLPVIMPSIIPESNLKKESNHIEGFAPQVFWIESKKNEEKLALRPTSETIFTPMFSLWIRSHRDLPLKLYQKGSVFRLDTKSTRPLIRGREFQWIEAHNAFETKQDAENQVKQDIEITEKVMHQQFGIPFISMKRPSWDKFSGAEYTIGNDVFMPDGKLIQQPSTHLMGQKFSKAFDAKFKNKKGEEEYLWTTAYGPAISRILVSIISLHGDNKGLILPSTISPIEIIIIPIYKSKNKKEILKYSEKIKENLKKFDFRVKIDDRENYTPGWKFTEWELKGIPLRIELGEKEINNEGFTIFIRDIKEKNFLKIKDIKKIKEILIDFDKRLKEKAEKFVEKKIVDCKTKKDIKKAINEKKIARVNFCSVEKDGIKCAEKIEKEFFSEVRGTLAKKKENPSGKCIICEKKAKQVVYIGKSY